MTWSTKYLGRDRDYIVVRHRLKGTEGMIDGVRFRAGYGVVDRNSKNYKRLKSLPFLKDCLEFPLVHLRGLKFIINNRAVETIYGKDVYIHYERELEELQKAEKEKAKEQAELKHLEEQTLCKFRRDNGELCKNEVYENSPGGHCLQHLLKDPMLEVLEIKVPRLLSKEEKKQWKDKVTKKLAKMKSKGIF